PLGQARWTVGWPAVPIGPPTAAPTHLPTAKALDRSVGLRASSLLKGFGVDRLHDAKSGSSSAFKTLSVEFADEAKNSLLPIVAYTLAPVLTMFRGLERHGERARRR